MGSELGSDDLLASYLCWEKKIDQVVEVVDGKQEDPVAVGILVKHEGVGFNLTLFSRDA